MPKSIIIKQVPVKKAGALECDNCIFKELYYFQCTLIVQALEFDVCKGHYLIKEEVTD